MNLREIFNEVCIFRNTLPDSLDCGDMRAMGEFMRGLGGSEIGEGCSSTAFTFRFPSGEFVIKVSHTEGGVNRLTRHTLNSNSVLRRHYLSPLLDSHYVVAQERMKALSERRGAWASRAILNRVGGGGGMMYADIHEGNVGYCPRRKRVMIFDATDENY